MSFQVHALQHGDDSPQVEHKHFYQKIENSQRWINAPLHDLCFLRTGLADPKEIEHCRYVGLEHIDPGTPSLSRWGLSTEVKSAKTYFYSGDILYGKLRPYLDKAVLAPFNGICSTDILVFAPKPTIEPLFLCYLLHSQHFTRFAVQSSHGVNHPRTSWSSLASFEHPIPPIDEQQAIAHILHAVQATIQARRREIELERERKATLAEYLFTHGTCNEPLKQTEFGRMPQSWKVFQLHEVAAVAYGFTVNVARRNAPQRVPYLTVANVIRGALRLDEVKQIGMLEGDAKRYRLQKGDVLLVEGNGNPALLGSAAVWNDELPFVLHQNHLIRVRPDQKIVLPDWLMGYLNSNSGRNQLLGKAKTSSGLHSINSQLVAHLYIPLPSLSEQCTIVEAMASCNTKITALEHEKELLEELFHTLLEDLMIGRISITPLIEKELLSNE